MALNIFGINLPEISLPKISPPKISLPKPALPKISVPKVEKPKPALPKLPEISLPKPPVISLPKVDLPKVEVPKPALPKLPEISLPTVELPKPAPPPPGGNIIDTVISARDESYEAGIENILSGNVAGGGAQFVGTAAADVILPMDLTDAVNKWVTGRGDEIDRDLLLWAAIDAVSLAAIPFTGGASYAAGRALKAGKVAGAIGKAGKVAGAIGKAGKVAGEVGTAGKIGGEMGLAKPVTKLIGGLSRAGQTAGKTIRSFKPVKTAGKTIRSFKPVKTAPSGSKAASEIAAAMRKQGEAILKQQKAAQKAALKSQKALIKQFTKTQKALTKSLEGLKPVEGAGKSSKLGSTLKTAGITAGGTAIGLTALGVLGAPAPEEVPEGGGGGAGGGADGGYTGGDDWWSEFIKSLYGGGAYDPSLYEGYDPYAGYYDPGYWDPLGVEPYAQDLLTYAEEIPVVGGVATAVKRSGFALPILIGLVIVVAIVVVTIYNRRKKKTTPKKRRKTTPKKSSTKAVTG